MNGDEVLAWFEGVNARAQQVVEAMARTHELAHELVGKMKAEKEAIVERVQVEGAESMVATAFMRLSDALKARNEAQETLADLNRASRADVIEAEVTAEVEVEFAANGRRSNAEQRRAEVVQRLNAHKDWLWLRDATHDAKTKLSQADVEWNIADRGLRVALALLESKVATLRALS